MRSNVPISKEIRSPETTEMMYPRPWACHLDIEDREKDGDQGHDNPHGLTLVKVRQHVGRRDVAEPFTQSPDSDPRVCR